MWGHPTSPGLSPATLSVARQDQLPQTVVPKALPGSLLAASRGKWFGVHWTPCHFEKCHVQGMGRVGRLEAGSIGGGTCSLHGPLAALPHFLSSHRRLAGVFVMPPK